MNLPTLSFLFLLIPFLAFTQQEGLISSTFIDCVEDYYNTNDLPINGHLYYPENTLAVGSAYFNKDWTTSTLYLNGVAYPEKIIKYNLVKDILIVKRKMADGLEVALMLETQSLDSFSIDNHHFVAKEYVFDDPSANGYVEKLYAGNNRYYLGQRKIYSGSLSEKAPHGSYLDAPKILYIKTPTALQAIQGKKDLMLYFEKEEKTLKKWMQQYKFNFKKASVEELLDLVQLVDIFNS